MEPNQPPPVSSLFQLNLDAGNSYTLRSAASWAKVFAISGIIIAILFFAVGALLQGVMSNYSTSRYYDGGTNNSRLLANAGLVVYVVMGLILLISSIFALNFANKVSRSLKTNDQLSLSGGFAGLRNYFAFWAILMIIVLLLLLISVISMAMR